MTRHNTVFLLSCTHVSLLQVLWRGNSSVVILLLIHRVEIRLWVLLVGIPNSMAVTPPGSSQVLPEVQALGFEIAGVCSCWGKVLRELRL